LAALTLDQAGKRHRRGCGAFGQGQAVDALAESGEGMIEAVHLFIPRKLTGQPSGRDG